MTLRAGFMQVQLVQLQQRFCSDADCVGDTSTRRHDDYSPFQGCMIDSGQGHTLDAELTFVRSGVFSQQPLLRASLVYRQNVG